MILEVSSHLPQIKNGKVFGEEDSHIYPTYRAVTAAQLRSWWRGHS